MALLKYFSVVIFLLTILKISESVKFVDFLASDTKPANLDCEEGCYMDYLDTFIKINDTADPRDDICVGFLCSGDNGIIIKLACDVESTPSNPGDESQPFPNCCPSCTSA